MSDIEPPFDSFDPPLTDEEWEPFAAAVGIEPPFISDRDALARLYLACIHRMSPSERRDAGLAPLLDDIGRYLGVPDVE